MSLLALMLLFVFLVFASSMHDKLMGEALFLGVGKEVLDKWLVSIIVLLLYLEYGVLLIKSLMERNFDGVTLVVTFDMSKSFTVLMF